MKWLIAVALGLGASLALAEEAEEPVGDRPNILFALADDWGWPHAGVYGDNVVKTPTFDRLAREGVLFEHAFVSSPSCTPSRNAILTGQQFYRLEEGASLHSTLDIKFPNFMYLLREAGYEIGHWRKAWGPGVFQTGGYTESPCGPASSFEEFMGRRETGKPFCFWFGTSDPHRGYKPGSGRKSGMEVDAIRVPGFFPATDVVRSDIADYYFEVQRWDREVGEALRLIEAEGELENTVIVMTGDHGMPFPRCKGNLYDMGVRVPLAIRWGAKVSPERQVSDFVSLTDLAPTFLEAAGLDAPAAMTGRSLLSVLTSGKEGRVEPARNGVVFGRERHTPAQKMPSMDGYPARGLRTDRWLLILNLEPARWPAGVPTGATHPMNTYSDCDNGPSKSAILSNRTEPPFAECYQHCFALRPAAELYDCRTDPDQIANLADEPEHAETLAALRKRLTAYLAGTRDPRFTYDVPVEFNTYPYHAGYLKTYLEEHEHDK